VLIYSGILLLVIALLFSSLLNRKSFKVDVVRDRASLARIVSGGHIENVYRLQIMNAAEKNQNFRIFATGMNDVEVMIDSENLVVASTQSRWVSVRLHVPYGSALSGKYPVQFTIEAVDENGKVIEKLEEKSVFLIPR
jgi:polyferredoxin